MGISNLTTLSLEDDVGVIAPEIEGREVTVCICDDEDDDNSANENEEVSAQPQPLVDSQTSCTDLIVYTSNSSEQQPPQQRENVAEENAEATRSPAEAGPNRNAEPSGVGVADLLREFSTDVPQPSAERAPVREPVQARVCSKDGIMGLDFSLQFKIHGAFNFEDSDLGAITIPKVPYDSPKLPFPIQETVQG